MQHVTMGFDFFQRKHREANNINEISTPWDDTTNKNRLQQFQSLKKERPKPNFVCTVICILSLRNNWVLGIVRKSYVSCTEQYWDHYCIHD